MNVVCQHSGHLSVHLFEAASLAANTNIIWTQNKSIVFIIKEFIVHDMYLIDVEENLVEQMKYIYGKGFKRLKDKVLGTNSTYMIH